MTSPAPPQDPAERVRQRQDGDYEAPVLREPEPRQPQPVEEQRPDNG